MNKSMRWYRVLYYSLKMLWYGIILAWWPTWLLATKVWREEHIGLFVGWLFIALFVFLHWWLRGGADEFADWCCNLWYKLKEKAGIE